MSEFTRQTTSAENQPSRRKLLARAAGASGIAGVILGIGIGFQADTQPDPPLVRVYCLEPGDRHETELLIPRDATAGVYIEPGYATEPGEGIYFTNDDTNARLLVSSKAGQLDVLHSDQGDDYERENADVSVYARSIYDQQWLVDVSVTCD